jgi:hypothetical protein
MMCHGWSMRRFHASQQWAIARLQAHNVAVRRVRCRIEKVCGTWKRSVGLRRTLTRLHAAA